MKREREEADEGVKPAEVPEDSPAKRHKGGGGGAAAAAAAPQEQQQQQQQQHTGGDSDEERIVLPSSSSRSAAKMGRECPYLDSISRQAGGPELLLSPGPLAAAARRCPLLSRLGPRPGTC
jgi:hypothetical protein